MMRMKKTGQKTLSVQYLDSKKEGLLGGKGEESSATVPRLEVKERLGDLL